VRAARSAAHGLIQSAVVGEAHRETGVVWLSTEVSDHRALPGIARGLALASAVHLSRQEASGARDSDRSDRSGGLQLRPHTYSRDRSRPTRAGPHQHWPSGCTGLGRPIGQKNRLRIGTNCRPTFYVQRLTRCKMAGPAVAFGRQHVDVVRGEANERRGAGACLE
jgi:hypothetical protein